MNVNLSETFEAYIKPNLKLFAMPLSMVKTVDP
jgi:hypothetical protein